MFNFEKSGRNNYMGRTDSQVRFSYRDDVQQVKTSAEGDENAMTEMPWLMQSYPFANVPLPYAYTALEPYIDERTVHLHRDKHLQSYIDHLNAALEPFPMFQNMTLETLIRASAGMDEPLKTAVMRNAGGVFNHFFYFFGMSPHKTAPMPQTAQMLSKAFGSMDGFMNAFTAAAMSVFGSGYAWLTIDDTLTPKIVTTPNQDTPFSLSLRPLLTIDVWEHAYYLKHYNERAMYIADWFNVVDWRRVEAELTRWLPA